MPALMISRITVRNPEKLQDYMAKTKDVASTYGAELLFQAKPERSLNGALDHQMIVIAQFPSTENLNAWFDSPEYQELVDVREEGADMHMTSYAV